jgi:cold shock CspA family protein
VSAPAGSIIRGTVTDFDDDRGTGTVTAADGSASWFFHCTAIADGSRTIDPGAVVDFRVVPGHLGRWEAADLAVSRPRS